MIITKNGFYDISEKNDSQVIIGDNLDVVIFDKKDIDRKVIIQKNSSLEYYGYLKNSQLTNREVFVNGENSKLKLSYLLLASFEEKIKAKIGSISNANNTNITTKIISIASNDSFIDIDGILKVEKNLKSVKGKLEENNIFLGESGKINSIPTLLVSSKDVNVSHSCKIEKINDEELFYLRSKGIEKQNSIQMILDSYIIDLFKCLNMIDPNFYQNLIFEIKTKILFNNN